MSGPLRVHEARVPATWIDYNGHMTEGAYGLAFGAASDALLAHAGFDERYRAEQRGSFYTVETHIRYRRELAEGDLMAFDTLVLGVDAKRLHAFHRMLGGGQEAATQETLLLHVDLDSGRVAPMARELLDRFAVLATEHAGLGVPEAVGAAIRPVPPGSPS